MYHKILRFDKIEMKKASLMSNEFPYKAEVQRGSDQYILTILDILRLWTIPSQTSGNGQHSLGAWWY